MANRHGVCNAMRDQAALKRCLVICIFFCMYWNIEAAQKCDLVKCVTEVRTFLSKLQQPGNKFMCRNLNQITECSDECMQQFYPHILLGQTNLPTVTQYCTENLATRVHANWSCIAQHTLRLLTCFGNISSINANDVREDVIAKQSCRKSLEYMNCPAEVLSADCGEESTEAMIDVFNFFMKYFMFTPCDGIDVKASYSLSVHYDLDQEYMKAARCFDIHHNSVGNCFEQRIQDEIDLNEYLCGENDYFGECMSFYVSEECKTLPSLRRLLPKLFSFAGIKCKQPNIHLKTMSPQHIQPSVETVLSNHEKHSSSHHILDDFRNTFSEITSDSYDSDYVTSVPTDTFRFLSTEDSSLQDRTKTNLEVMNKDKKKSSSKKYSDATSSSVMKNSTNSSPSHKDTDYFKTSGGNYLICDKLSCTVLLLIVLMQVNRVYLS